MLSTARRLLELISSVALWPFTVACFVVDEFDEEEEGDDSPDVEAIAKGMHLFRRMRKRVLDQPADDEPAAKRKKYDYERAMQCVTADHLGNNPPFDNQFDRIFRVTRGITERILQVCGDASEFFTRRLIVSTGEMGIHPEVKVLMALKTLAFGCSSAAFIDYFQMSATSGQDCLKEFCKVISSSELRNVYLRQMSPSDARRVHKTHLREFGVPGCIGCLDCMHVHWRTCPVAWQGQHKGKEGKPSIVLEALADYTAWIWHLTFGFPGTLNDINTWDQSALLRAFLDGTFSDVIDFVFYVGDETLTKLWIMVDGICPELSRFVKTVSVPLGKKEKKCSDWQENKRKSVERAFGIAQRKFQILARPMEMFYQEEIKSVVETCFTLHNMMVEQRLLKDQEEGEEWCLTAEATEEDEGEDEDEEDECVGRHSIDVEGLAPNARAPKATIKERIEAINAVWPAGSDERLEAVREAINQHVDSQQQEWDQLCDPVECVRLRNALMNEATNKNL